MKKVLIIFLLFFTSKLHAQLTDDFNDGNFTGNPAWTGSNGGGDFVVIDNKLRSNSSNANSSFYLSTENLLAINVQWEFWVNLQFSTSGSNYMDIYVVSDKADLKSSLINGYFIRIGNTDDEISLYKRTGAANAIVKIIDGANGSVGSSNNTIKIKLKRDHSGTFTLDREIVGAGSSYITEGNVIDISHTTASHFGILVQQSTSSFFQKHFIDNVLIVPITTDTSPPFVTTVSNIDSNTVEILFNEPMDTVSVKTPYNYLLNNNSGSILNIKTTNDPAKFILNLTKTLESGSHLLAVTNVKDRNGNLIGHNNFGSFTYIKPYFVRYGDIVINEIFADPSPQIDLPSVEFVELRNTSSQKLSLKNWKFTDSGGSSTLGEIQIEPDSFVILCAKADTADYKSFGNVIGLSPWPTLNNSGEILKLLSPENRIIDSVRYSDTWYRNSLKKLGGWTLERRDPVSKCESRFNWFASTDSSGGTPGRENSIHIEGYDLMPLIADSIKQTSDTSISIKFNKHLDAAALIPANFKLIPNNSTVKKITADIDLKTVQLTYDKNLEAGIEYQLQIFNLKDCGGKLIGSPQEGLKFKTIKTSPIIEPADTANLIISEIFADPSPEVHLPLAEFIELHNPTKDTVDLDKWTLSDPTTMAMIRGQKILPQEFIIICPIADTVQYKSYGRTIGVSPWPSLNNNSDQIILRSSKNRIVDSVGYSDMWYKNVSKKAGGWSMEKVDLKSVCEDFFNWTASIDTNGGTPGKPNSVNISNYDGIKLKVDSVKLTSDTTVKLYFNKHLNGATLIPVNFQLTPENPLRKITSDIQVKEITLSYYKRFESGTNYQITISGIKDCSGNLIFQQTPLSFKTKPPQPPVFVKPDTAMLVISEIFADPSPEVHLPLAEFIEIHNPSKDTIDLDKWTLSDPATMATIRGQKIQPLEYIILCPIADTVHYKLYGRTIGLNPWPSLNNAADLISLKSFKNRTVDSIAYSDAWYKNISKKAGGWSMEKVDLKSVCEDFFNWTASIDTNGGTPGKPNSVNISNYDGIKLKVDSVKLTSDTTVKLYFNKHLNSATLIPVHFQLTPENPLRKITSDIQVKEITLSYSKRFESGTNYQITISGIKDCSGNLIFQQTPLSFKTKPPQPPVFVKPDTAMLVISEIFADPSPEVHLPLAEFIEIHNPTKDTVDLDKWTLSDPTTMAMIRGQKILPQEFIIICPIADTVQYKPYGRTIGLTPWPSLNNNTDQIILRSFKNRIVDSVGYSDMWYRNINKKAGGWSIEKIDLKSICEDFFNWTAATDTNGGTPGKRNSVNILGYDVIPLRIDSIKLTTDSTLKLTFNKHMNTATFVAENFNLNPTNGKIMKITTDNFAKEVTLTYNKRIPASSEFQLFLSNLKDCSGNLIDPHSILKFKTPPPPPVAKIPNDTARILITEIFADPSPEVNLPLAEFIEIYNPSADTVNLDRWIISDPTTKALIRQQKILPGEYVILCPMADTTFYKPYGKTIGLSPWPSLNNAADQICFRSFKNRLVDSVAYSDKWYRDRTKKNGGWSLERVNLSDNSCGFYNWASSTDKSGGTPGRKNSGNINYRLREIEINSLLRLSDSTVAIYLSSIPDTAYLKLANFTINNNIGSATAIHIEDDYKTIHLTYASKFQEGVTYILKADSLFSCNGYNANIPARQVSFTIPVVPELEYPIVINEIFADPSPQVGLPETEFIELYNPTDKTVSLKGMIYGDETSQYRFTHGEIPALSYLILTPEKDTINFIAFGKVMGIPGWPNLANDKDVLILKSNKGRELQRVAYNASWYKDTAKKSGGYSLEMINHMSICKDSQNWSASRDPLGGTPGRPNSVYNNTSSESLKLINVVMMDSLSILLTFSKPIDSLSASFPNKYHVNNGAGIPEFIFPLSPTFEKVLIKFSKPLARGHVYKITAIDLTDCAGSTIQASSGSMEFFLANKIVKDAILVNEILFNPRSGGVDFVEIYNNTKHTLDLKDLSIATILKDTVSNAKAISLNQRLFESGQYLAITSDPEILKKEYIIENPDKLLKASLPQFNDDRGTVVLVSNGGRVDQFDYTDKLHFPLLKSLEGVSLERSSFNLRANEPGNFRSATAASGYATPGKKNSQYSEVIIGNDEFKLISRTFSPDNDGFEDQLQISYKTPVPGMVANVKIFNDRGALIRNLVKNLTLNTTGLLVWDGLDELTNPAIAGIYILYAEIFDTNGNVKKFRKSFALATKL
ncbi:lamin tail domain-containing protein [Daejeonella lutea]|uniref:Lamin Tail Domain n=1 Tax=Daejeonella lutea TaxID=572036 RepID=A0A1T5CSD6_9SPHI|nr:lamin tail domain-containing protein [Daejeonella lutea]SKB62408.1 Lamin Tail Domain [Daejeonella lutea]